MVKTLRALLGHPTMITAMCFAFTVAICFATVDLLAVLELGSRGVSATALGLILAAGALLGVGAGALSGRLGERIGSFGLCLLGAIGLTALTVLLAFSLPTWAIAAGIMAIGPLFPLLMTGIYPLVASTSDDLGVAHGTANGVINIFWTGATAVVPLAAAQIADAFGDAAAYSTAAALTALLIAIAVVMRSRARNLSLSH